MDKRKYMRREKESLESDLSSMQQKLASLKLEQGALAQVRHCHLIHNGPLNFRNLDRVWTSWSPRLTGRLKRLRIKYRVWRQLRRRYVIATLRLVR